jgi:arylsulfatase A-like enzyme
MEAQRRKELITMKNVVLITIDSLRPDHVSHLGYARNTTPFIDQLAGRGASFQRAMTNGPTTRFAFVSILGSDYPFLQLEMGLSEEIETTLAEALHAHGYATAAFHTVGWLSRAFSYDRGFTAYFDETQWGFLEGRLKSTIRHHTGRWLSPMSRVYGIVRRLLANTGRSGRHLAFSYRPAPEINERALNWIRSQEEPLFVWLHYMDVHLPFQPHNEYLREFRGTAVTTDEALQVCEKAHRNVGSLTDDELALLIDLYDAEIKYTDRAIGDLIRELDDWVVVITADHGEGLGEHGAFHECSVYDEMLRVPLVICHSDYPEGTVVPHQVSLIDLPPTILELLDMPPVESFRGQSLVPYMTRELHSGRTIYAGYVLEDERVIACRDGGWKLIVSTSTEPQLYDLASDPNETINVAPKLPDRVAELQQCIQEVSGEMNMETSPAVDVKRLPEETIRHLQGLGYVE